MHSGSGFLLSVGCLVCAVLSCETRPTVTPLTSTLETYTARDVAGKWMLRGVRVSGTDSIVISPDNYKSISADENFIIATKSVDGMNLFWIFELNGKPVGWFDTFNHFKSNQDSVKMDYYCGTNYDQRFYYFPKTGVAIRTKEEARFEQGQDYMLIFDGDEWKAFTYDGIPLTRATQTNPPSSPPSGTDPHTRSAPARRSSPAPKSPASCSPCTPSSA